MSFPNKCHITHNNNNNNNNNNDNDFNDNRVGEQQEIDCHTNQEINNLVDRHTTHTDTESINRLDESESVDNHQQSVSFIDVKPILKRKSLDEIEIKTLPSILKKKDSFDYLSKHAILKRHSLGSESDNRNPKQFLITKEIDISSTPSSSSKPSKIHSILKHKSFDEKFVQSRDDQSLPKPILKKNLSIEDEIEKCLNINNGTNGSNAGSSSQLANSPTDNSNGYYSRTRSILKFASEHQKTVVMNPKVEVKSILKTGHKNDSKPVKSALKKSDLNFDTKSEVKSILKSESIGSNEKINLSDTDSSSSDDNNDVDLSVSANSSVETQSQSHESSGVCSDNNHKNNDNSIETNNSCAFKTKDEKPNQRFLANNRQLETKRPNSCIVMNTNQLVNIDDQLDEQSEADKDVGQSIFHRLAALKQNGEEGWKKRISKCDNKEVTLRVKSNENVGRVRTTSIADRLSLLEDSSQKWKNRVQEKDVKQFTVEGKMLEKDTPVKVIPDVQRKTPKATVFRSEKTAEMLNTQLRHSLAVPKLVIPQTNGSNSQCIKLNDNKPVVLPILKTDDDNFNSFFSIDTFKSDRNEIISNESFDSLSTGMSDLLIQKRSVKPQGRRKATTNPIRSLSERTDFIVDSYVEFDSKENDKIDDKLDENNVKPKRSKDLVKSSSFAASALAGLATREDIRGLAGKLRSSCSSPRDSWKSYDMPNSMQTLMLVQIKGRRRAQTRLVEPTIKSMNSGDSYILVSRDSIYVWIGEFSNVIEKTKALEIANQIQEKKDLCFRSSNSLVIIDCQKKESINKQTNEMFLKQLNANFKSCINLPNNPEEDEIYEDTIIGTNMIYRVNNEQLVPYEPFWGQTPRYEMLDSEKCFVFDFGSEMYVWIGSKAQTVEKKCALDSAKDLWNKGYDYTECDINPFGLNITKKDTKRPHWSWFMKVSQNMESILFKDKFVNWPSTPSATKTKKIEIPVPKNIYSDNNFSTIDAKSLIESKAHEPDMILETAHLGRGVRWDDELEGRHISITSLDVKCWLISDYEKHELLNPDMYYFYSGDTYVVRWHYRLSRVGRELKTGNISRHSMIGRDRICYFFWHGLYTKSTEKGASALMTIELDKEKAQQVRVSQGNEDPCFLNIFNGSLVILNGKRGNKEMTNCQKWRLFYIRGVLPNEASLVEVIPKVQSLRSRTAFAFVNPSSHLIYVWFGCKCLDETRQVMRQTIENLIKNKWSELLKPNVNYTTKEINENEEESEFWNLFESHDRRQRRKLYYSLLDSPLTYKFSPRLYHLSSSSGEFTAKEILCSQRSCDYVTPYPFTQEDLYSAQQPTFFLLDNESQIFLWESKYAFTKQVVDESEVNTTTGSQNIRWNAERKYALDSALAYCFAKNSKQPPNGYVVCAGLEPNSFCALFPQWTTRQDVSNLHIKDGRKAGEMVSIQEVLSQYRTNYSLDELRKKPLPEALNPLSLESYLSADDFKEALEMTREEFYGLPLWKQTYLKQKANLF
ncbi:supervillin-like [Oppia nitens]|uniref:supervillin-like n=1 Tax=Oppia nitens TaxID=1686743 RepID=UPI0023DCD7CF|nr:supervillin-like [Oppia nitens]